MEVTQPRYSPHRRARIRAFFADGVDKLHLPWAVEALPTMLHVSLFLFFSGLVIFLFNINLTVFKVVMSWVGFCTTVYVCITFMPIFRHDSPYYAPLSSSAWYLYSGTLYVVYRLVRWILLQDCFSVATWRRLEGLKSYSGLFSQGIAKAAEETARKLSSEIDWRVLIWTLESLDEEHELERFFSGLPGFWNSRVVNSRPVASIRQDSESLADALIGFVHRTISSDLISETVREQRITLCRKALDVASLPINKRTFRRAVRGDWNGLLASVEFGLFLRGVDHNDPHTTYYSRSMISIIIANARLRDDRWVDLTTGHLGVSKSALQNYTAHGDSVLLANLIHIIRVTIHSYSGLRQLDVTGWKIFETASRLDVKDTLPELQHDFCALWNDVVLLVTSAEDERVQTISRFILINSRRIYIALHQGTDSAPTTFSTSTGDFDLILYSPTSYPLCNVLGHRHRSDLTPHNHEPEVAADTIVAFSDVPHATAAIITAADPSTTSGVDVASPLRQNPHHANLHISDSPLPNDATPILEHLSLVTTLHQPGPPETRCAHSSASIASVGLTQGMGDASTSLAHDHPDPTVNSAAAALPNKETINSPPTIQAAPLLPIHHGSASCPSASTGAFSHVSPLVAAVSVSIPIIIPNPAPSSHDEFPDLNLPTQVETPRHAHQSELLVPGTVSKLDDVGCEPLDDPSHFPHDLSGS